MRILSISDKKCDDLTCTYYKPYLILWQGEGDTDWIVQLALVLMFK